jgi:hypothetical protein
MYHNNPQASSDLHKAGEEVIEGNYFVVDWVCSNPMRPGKGMPSIIAGNINKEEMELLVNSQIPMEEPRFGTKQRILLKVAKVYNIKEK